MIMCPVDGTDKAVKSEIISHARNSHTLIPTIRHGPEFIKEFSLLNGKYLIDFPGMFDSKGPEIDIAIELLLQMIVKKANSTKILLLLSAS